MSATGNRDISAAADANAVTAHANRRLTVAEWTVDDHGYPVTDGWYISPSAFRPRASSNPVSTGVAIDGLRTALTDLGRARKLATRVYEGEWPNKRVRYDVLAQLVDLLGDRVLEDL
jgi:hypothetical protein